MEQPAWEICGNCGPVVMTAIHSGHSLRREVADLCALTPMQRLQEEDPYTDRWVRCGDSHIIVHRSRFEVDFNRTAENCVYRTPEDAWGMQVWKHSLPNQIITDSRTLHRQFYQQVGHLLDTLLRSHPCLAVLDIHSYNHRRDGPSSPPAEAKGNPDVDLLIPAEEHQRWRQPFEMISQPLADITLNGKSLSLGRNTRFQRAAFGEWLTRTYGERIFVLVIEFKKIFMDEWTGQADEERVARIATAIDQGVTSLRHFFAS